MISRALILASLVQSLWMGSLICHAKSSDQHEQCPHQSSAAESHAAMMARGEQGMGFSQTATTHHFLLKADGGVISVSANDAKDVASRDQIRMHLRHIAQAFSEGNFEIPMFVHGQTPTGVPTMKARSKDINYGFVETGTGGEVTLISHDPEAIEAIHEFLKFQIREHRTGDSLTVEKPRQ